MKNELKVMGYYVNSTREDQLVQIKDIQRGSCTETRFRNLYIEKR